MRLLEYKSNDNFILHEFIGTKVPVYAILSHTWATGEVTIQEVENGTGKDKAGWKKIVFCAKQADADGLRYLWVDTCCIDKKNAVELQEAINSMFRWYQNAARCYVYMSDVSIGEDDEQDSPPKWEAAFKKSRWFRRGWTLQELIAPSSVEFFDSNGRQIGSKEELTQQIHDVTRIPVTILRGDALTEFDVNERMSWARGRETMRPEDMAYSLLGILGVHMPLIYGEGMPNALNRLQWEIERRPNEQTRGLSRNPILSPHPVGRNYRMVIVMVIHWEGDGLETMVESIVRVFQELYHYEVRDILLSTTFDAEKESYHWPWPNGSNIEETDLQILYYLGNTTKVADNGRGFLDLQALPLHYLSIQNDSVRILDRTNWLQRAIGLPNLASDVLIVLDCLISDTVSGITPLPDGGHPSTRYGIIAADYSSGSSGPPRFSKHLMRALEHLARSGQAANWHSVIKRIEQELRVSRDAVWPVVRGYDGMDSMILSPIGR